ncbi:MAG: hypothetical protein E7641_08620 [Ruminococcaceae bacterium]|nr:hypothetical protein [Oscillospiraceae bacterium]
MNLDNRKFFWIICIVTTLVGIYWSAISLMQRFAPLFIAFLAINVLCFIIVLICRIVDKKKTKKQG